MKEVIKKVNANTFKKVIKVCDSEIETESNTLRIIVPKNPSKQMARYMRSKGLI